LGTISMTTTYNRIAGQNIERLAALSDGIFGVAMTLLVLDLRLPAPGDIHSERDLWHAIAVGTPQLLMYLMSFITLGIFWVGQQTQLNHLARSNRSFTWIHLLFLFAVTIMPFSTKLLAEFIAYRVALLAYWANILLLGAVLYFSWNCAIGSGLLKADIGRGITSAIKRRIVIAQMFYAFGAALCVISTYWSIAFIVAVQLYYAIAPRLPWRRERPNDELRSA
jgi:uncharacterized membrane protein